MGNNVLGLDQLDAWLRSEEHKGAVLVSPTGPICMIDELHRLQAENVRLTEKVAKTEQMVANLVNAVILLTRMVNS
jgi:hypothetical protein